MSDDQVTFQKDRPKSWPAGLFVTSKDIDKYIREYNLHQQNKSSFYDYAERPINVKSSETLIDKGFGYNEHDEIGYYDVPRKVEVYELDSGAEYVREEQERILEEKKKSNKALHEKWMKEGLTELAKTIEPKNSMTDGRWNWYGEGEEE
jgi:hypothetical protein